MAVESLKIVECEFEGFQHFELGLLVAGGALLVFGFWGGDCDEVFGAKGLEFDGIRPGCGGDVDEFEGVLG